MGAARRVLLVLALCRAAEGERLSLTPAQGAFLVLSGQQPQPLLWNASRLARLLAQSALVEVSARGVRCVAAGTRLLAEPPGALAQSRCTPSARALCASAEGELFPSWPGAGWGPDGAAPVTDRPQDLRDPVLRAFAELGGAGACGGAGRAFGTAPYYVVTACDLAAGAHVLVVRSDTMRAILYRSTFGPAAYLVVLVSAAASVAGVAAGDQGGGIFALNAALAAGVCVAQARATPFFTGEDLGELCVAAALAAAYACAAAARGRPGASAAACLYSLDAIATALYRTPETPYAPVLCCVHLVRVWGLLLRQAAARGGALAELNACAAHAALFVHAGVRPQVAEGAWPVYALTGLLGAYALARNLVQE